MRRRDLLLASAGLTVPPQLRGPQNWGKPIVDLTFGSARPGATIRDRSMLCDEVHFYDQFGQSNVGGGEYLADKMAPPECTDPGPAERYSSDYPFHEVMPESLRCYVRPKDRTASVVMPQPLGARQPVGASGFRLKYAGPGGLGSLSGWNLCWETRCRFSKPLPYFWFALWLSGEAWDHGAELDVPETFGWDNGLGGKNYDGRLLHANSVGGTDRIIAGNWGNYTPVGMAPMTEWHTFTTTYRRDDSWSFYVDGQLANDGHLEWRIGGRSGARKLDRCYFLVDNSWGHQKIASVRPDEVSARIFDGFYYEYDYTRIWLAA